MTVKRISIIVWISILVAWIFDQLFWQKAPGISFPILVAAALAAGYIILRSEGKTIALSTWLLLPPIIFFSVMFTYRSEELTRAIDVLMTLLLVLIMGLTATGGRWWVYSFSDYVVKSLHMMISTLSGVLMVWINGHKKAPGENGEEAIPEKKASVNGWAVIRGILLALPIVLVLAALLAAGDPVFNQHYQEFFDLLDIDNLPEYLFRLFYILILGYMLAGAYIHAVNQSHDTKLIGEEKPWMSAFLGHTEAFIILGAVNALFFTFILIQVNYLFGGNANIHADGYTYAEYARKGFTELLVVAVISLLLLQVISAITHRTTKTQASVFSGLSIGLVTLVIVILISAFQRLNMYMNVYGFTRIRVYSETFMIWLAVLLLATAVLELIRRERFFAFACLLTAIGFAATINVINVDHQIAAANIQRAMLGEDLDAEYLATLSDDIVPYMVDTYQANNAVSARAGGVLRCWIEGNTPPEEAYRQNQGNTYWEAYHFGKTAAWQAVEPIEKELKNAYPLHEDTENYQQYILVNGTRINCPGWGGWD